MLKKILFMSSLCCALTIPCLATNWQKVPSPPNKLNIHQVYIDTDSIRKNSNSAVFNIKYVFNDNSYDIMTIYMTYFRKVKPISFIECSPDDYLMKASPVNPAYTSLGKKNSVFSHIYDMIFGSI